MRTSASPSKPSASKPSPSSGRLAFAWGGALLFVAAGALAACAAPGRGPVLDSPDADRLLYESKCGVCHVPFGPRDFEPFEWPAIVDHFAARAGLTRSQKSRVLRHLVLR